MCLAMMLVKIVQQDARLVVLVALNYLCCLYDRFSTCTWQRL